MELRTISKVAILLFLLSLIGFASSKRAVMVVETKGRNMVTVDTKTARMRTLQVLPQGAKIEVPSGATLRLSYFSSGKKEKIVGPCKLLVNENSSTLLDGAGKLEVQTQRDHSTRLDEKENLRRMGGALQAYNTDTPDDLLIKLEQSRVAQAENTRRSPMAVSNTNSNNSAYIVNEKTSVTGNTRTTKKNTKRSNANAKVYKGPLKLLGLSPVYLGPNSLSEIRFKGPVVAVVKLFKDNSELSSSLAPRGRYVLPDSILQAGSNYKVTIRSGNKSLSREFTILGADEKLAYQRRVDEIKNSGHYDHRSMYAHLLVLQTDMGLYSVAKTTAAKALKEYPSDPGFLTSSAWIEYWLGNHKAAKKLLERASEAEQETYK